MNKSIQQKGFSAAEAVLVIVFVGLLGAGGWLVYQRTQADAHPKTVKASVVQSKPTSTANATSDYQLPLGYTLYKNRGRGFTFAYPSTFGTLASTTDASGNEVLASGVVSPEPDFGIKKGFTLTVYPNASAVIGSRKYGPDIKLTDDGWIIVKAGTIPGKVGEKYMVDGKVPPSQSNGKLVVYTLYGGDEGVEADSFAFVSRGRLVVITLPYFVDQGYNQPIHTDKTDFNKLFTTVRDSIQPING
jgi:hypothetical protein